MSASEPEQLDGALEKWRQEIDTDDRFAGMIYRSSFQSYLGGQLFVRGIELGADATVSLDQNQRAEGDSFLAMPFEEALSFFRSKNIITPAEFDTLRDRYKAGGFIARRLASESLVETARANIESLLSQGSTIPDVWQAIRAEELRLGIEPASPQYLDTVIRTNVASAYGHGRYMAMADPVVAALRPFWQYRSAGDSRVRPGHRALHGLVFDANSELGQRYSPPLFYNCRCTMVTLSSRQITERGLAVTNSRVEGIEVESFWADPPVPLTQGDL